MAAVLYEYPPELKSGSTSKHWISFDAYAFSRGTGNGTQTLDIALYIPNDALQTAYKSEYSMFGYRFLSHD